MLFPLSFLSAGIIVSYLIICIGLILFRGDTRGEWEMLKVWDLSSSESKSLSFKLVASSFCLFLISGRFCGTAYNKHGAFAMTTELLTLLTWEFCFFGCCKFWLRSIPSIKSWILCCRSNKVFLSCIGGEWLLPNPVSCTACNWTARRSQSFLMLSKYSRYSEFSPTCPIIFFLTCDLNCFELLGTIVSICFIVSAMYLVDLLDPSPCRVI